ncbi:DNA recombination protein RmuC [Chromohalobacter israelensis]
MPSTVLAPSFLLALAGLMALATLTLGVAWRRERGRRVAAEQEAESARHRLDEDEATRARLERELAQSDAQLDAAREQGLETQRRLAQCERELGDRQEQLAALRERHGRLETQREQEHAHHAEKLALLEEARTRLTQDFEALAGRIFEERQQAFSAQSRESLETLLAPFREQVGDFRARLEEIHGQSLRERSSLKTQIEHLATLNRQITEEASNLTRALKGDKKMQGDWGEVMLESVLERSGLRRDIEYKREVSIEGDAGRQRPDAVIYLPDQRHLIVDAKVSLNAYVRYVNAEDDATRAQALRAHVQAVRGHIEALSGRDYPRLPGLNSPDFVFLFMPVEPAFAVAFQHDETLFHDAFARDIVVVTPTTLLASLRTVASLWTLERQNDNARVIAERAGKLLDKFRGFVDSLEEVGRHLERADGSYRQAMGRLSTGQGSLVSQALMLKRLGVRMKRDLPEHLTQGVDDDDPEAVSEDEAGEPGGADDARAPGTARDDTAADP